MTQADPNVPDASFSTTEFPDADGPLQGAYRPVTISLMSAIALVSYNNLSVTAALPNIGDDLGSVGLLPWIITIELFTSAVAVLAIGPLIDSFGVQRVFRFSMVGFVGTSLACAFAPEILSLISFRAIQGVAAGGVMGVGIACVGLAYAPHVRPAVYALVSAVWGVMGVAGPAIAAVLISIFGWRSIFSVALPIGATAAAIGWNRLPGERATRELAAFDRVGLGLVAVVASALLMAASTRSAWAFAGLVAALLVGGIYVAHTRRVAQPVVHLHHLSAPRWRNVHITSTCAVAATSGSSAFLPLYLKGARSASQTEAAFSVLFMVIGWSIGAWVSSRLQRRMHPAIVVRIGSTLLITSLSLATLITYLKAPVPVLLAAFVAIGGGVGAITTGGLSILQGRADPEEMGRVSSAHQFLRSLGFTYGAAIAGLMVFLVVERQVGEVETVRELLGNEVVNVSADAVAALQDGFVAAMCVMALSAAVTSISARKLAQSVGTNLDHLHTPEI